MQVELKANGKTVHAEISEEQAKILGLAEDKPKTGYERVKNNEIYYLVDIYGNIMRITEYNDQGDKQSYDTGNYYSDKVIAENNARADRLLCCLRQWQALNDEPISVKYWEDETWPKWRIMYNYDDKNLFGNPQRSARVFNTVYFTTKEKAQEAIEQFKGELLWYFTEYQQRLDEV